MKMELVSLVALRVRGVKYGFRTCSLYSQHSPDNDMYQYISIGHDQA